MIAKILVGVLMPRSPRYSFPGAIHHVMLRGDQGRPIFYSNDDRVQCCLLIQEVMERYGHRIHGYCLMSNHIHYLGTDPVTWVECDYVLKRYSEDRAIAIK
jgi:REP element-mobilizing transposase RayT